MKVLDAPAGWTVTRAFSLSIVLPPPHAASTQTWTFGTRTWSAAIQMPDCNKTGFKSSFTEPDGRSHTAGANTRYYYNWAYVNANQSTMCPSPWRVPTNDDLQALFYATNGATLISEWGSGGYVSGNTIHNGNARGYYWSSTAASATYAHYLDFYDNFRNVGFTVMTDGFQVRCVK